MHYRCPCDFDVYPDTPSALSCRPPPSRRCTRRTSSCSPWRRRPGARAAAPAACGATGAFPARSTCTPGACLRLTRRRSTFPKACRLDVCQHTTIASHVTCGTPQFNLIVEQVILSVDKFSGEVISSCATPVGNIGRLHIVCIICVCI